MSALFAIAAASERFASGEIDLTNRGNLQLRGVSEETYSEALAALGSAGLIDAHADAEAVRNVVVDPLSGLDPARADLRALADLLERKLSEEEQFWALPGKFGVSFSGSAQPCVGGRPADVMVAAGKQAGVAIFLDGEAAVAAHVPAHEAVDAVLRLVEAFLRRRADDPSLGRMRNAVAQYNVRTIFADARLVAEAVVPSPPGETSPRTPPVGMLSASVLTFATGVGLPFGRILARELEALARVAEDLAIPFVNTGPERVLVFPTDDLERASELLAEAAKLQVITQADDLRLAMDVCPGAPACANASTETRRDAQRLVELLKEDGVSVSSLHISGCEKGCARRGAAAVTLVACDGRYDVIGNAGPDGPIAVAGVASFEMPQAVEKFIRDQRR
jgi:precorrin-3B synthase